MINHNAPDIKSKDKSALMYDEAFKLHQQGLNQQAEAAYREILKEPQYPVETLVNLAILVSGDNPKEAITLLNQALEVYPGDEQVFFTLAFAYKLDSQPEKAVTYYKKALEKKGDNAHVYFNLANVYKTLNQLNEAVECYHKAIELKPTHDRAYYNLGLTLKAQDKWVEAIACYKKAIEINPVNGNAIALYWHQKQYACDWQDLDKMNEQVLKQLEVEDSGQKCAVMEPLPMVAIMDNPQAQLIAARSYINDRIKRLTIPHRPIEKKQHDKIKVAYLSADLYDHATSHLMVEIFERHDRERFEIHAINFGPLEEPSDMFKRVRHAFDHFHQSQHLSDEAISDLIRVLEIDIAVDLKGYTLNCRSDILSYRPAPIQVAFLGYPGTMGASFIDYMIADPFTIPEKYQPYYSEKIAYMPQCYQPNDRQRKIAKTLTRSHYGLPQDAFVFCCFNANYKITPEIFNIWVRILKQVENSVLWLYESHHLSKENLIKEAKKRGIDNERLIFATSLPNDEHIARVQLADLILDTHPCNAHTTASDALWAGVPIVTYAGESFASRVCGSLLTAHGLEELVTESLKDYEALILSLAKDKAKLARIRQKCWDNREHSALFDSEAFTKGLESAYQTMYQLYQNDKPPETFYVDKPKAVGKKTKRKFIVKPPGVTKLAEPRVVEMPAPEPEPTPPSHHKEDLFQAAIKHLKMAQVEKAISCYHEILNIDSQDGEALSQYCFFSDCCCEWQGRENRISQLNHQLQAQHHQELAKPIRPFTLLGLFDDVAKEQMAARDYYRAIVNAIDTDKRFRQYQCQDDKIKIAYVSNDFHDHATSYLMAEFFESHTRSQFEIHAFSFGIHIPHSKMRQRLQKAFDYFYDVSDFTDFDVAKKIHDLGIHIAIDLKGYTYENRVSIFAYRPAPIQISMIGYPGTMGCPDMDYIIADKYVIPHRLAHYYQEKIITMPHSYQVNDAKRHQVTQVPTRQSQGLPEVGFVFCCFNYNFKISPEMFAVWMRLLNNVAGSVLWLFESTDSAKEHLIAQAQALGISTERLIFAKPMMYEQHLARIKLADLFLDTYPCNAHTTASDALWVELPLVTLSGQTFASRVAGSLLKSLSLDELVTNTFDDYEQRCLTLATDQRFYDKVKSQLSVAVKETTLFKAKPYVQSFEKAMMKVVKRYRDDLLPVSFEVEETMTARIDYHGCPLCDNQTSIEVKMLEGDDNITWLQCQGCQHEYTSSYLSDRAMAAIFIQPLKKKYDAAYYEKQRLVSSRLIEKVLPFKDKGRWIDVGFGDGTLLMTAKEYGFTPIGFELRDALVKQLQLDNIECYVDDFINTTQTAEVISFCDLLEHLPFPQAALMSAHHSLSAEGVLLISLPNRESPYWQILDDNEDNEYWAEVEHFHNFSRTRIYKLLNDTGFDVVHYGVSERYRVGMEIIALKKGR